MYYTLNLVCEDPELRRVYESAAAKHNANVDKRDADPTSVCCDAGFDLHVPEQKEIDPRSTAQCFVATTCIRGPAPELRPHFD